MNPLLTDALGYFARGWSLIPIVPQTKKAAAAWTAHQKERASEAMIRLWFDKPKYPGIGVIFGKVSGGLASRDYDNPEAYRRWAADHPDLAATLPTVETGRGFHLYFRAASERFENCGDGEYRGNSGHYSVLPPTIHPSGKPYRWMIPLPAGDLPLIDPVKIGFLQQTPTPMAFNVSTISEFSEDSAISVISITTEDDLIAQTQPARPGKRNDCIMLLARGVKFNLGIADMQIAKGIVKKWHARALPMISTKDFDTTWSDFVHAYQGARHALGKPFIALAMEKVNRGELPAVAGEYDNPTVKKLVGICAALAVEGNGYFFVSSHTLANCLNIKPMQAWRFLRMLEADGVLQCLDAGTAGEHGRAARFKWCVNPTE